jgi:hypothetical protein
LGKLPPFACLVVVGKRRELYSSRRPVQAKAQPKAASTPARGVIFRGTPRRKFFSADRSSTGDAPIIHRFSTARRRP